MTLMILGTGIGGLLLTRKTTAMCAIRLPIKANFYTRWVFGDPPSMHYWTPFAQQQEHLKAELNLDKRLVEGYLQYLRSNPDNTDVRELKAEAELISCYGIRDWSRDPFERGCHIWKAGVHVEEPIKELTAFSLDDLINQ